MIEPEGLSAEDRYTVVARTKEVFTPFLLTLQISFGFILNRKAIEQAGESYGRATAIAPFRRHGNEQTEWNFSVSMIIGGKKQSLMT